MLTLPAGLVAALQSAHPQVRRLVSFTIADGVEHTFVDGEDSLYGYLPSIVDVSSTSLEIDPVTRALTAGELSVTMADDGIAREMITGGTVQGKQVRVRIGTADIPEAAYTHEWRGIVTSYAIASSGEVTFACADAVAYLSDLEITVGAIAWHPVEVMRQILTTYVPSELWSGFDFEADTDRSHWSLSRYDARSTIPISTATDAYARAQDSTKRLIATYRTARFTYDELLTTPQNAWELMQELAEIAGGALRLDSDGRLEFAGYDAAATPVAHWTANEIIDAGTIDSGTVINRVNVTADVRSGTTGNSILRINDYPQAQERVWPLEDTTAQAALALAGSAIGRVYAGELDNNWIRSVANISGPTTSIGTGATSIEVANASMVGFSGARYRYGFRGSAGGGIAITGATINGGGTEVTLTVASHWLEAGAYITTSDITTNVTTPTAITSATATTIVLPLVGPPGAMADGVGWIHPEQDPLDTLTSGREAVFLLCDDAEDPTRIEIVRATAGAATAGTAAFSDPREFSLGRYSHPSEYTYTITRAQYGTTALAFDTGVALVAVFDMTIPFAIAEQRLARYAYGAPTCEMRVSLDQLAVQLGDFVTMDRPEFAYRNQDGADSSVVWEVVAREVDLGASPPSIRVMLVMVRID